MEKENLKEKQEKAIRLYLSSKSRKRWQASHNLFKKRLRYGAYALGVAYFCKFSMIGWYYFEYDINPYNPKLSKYITERLGKT